MIKDLKPMFVDKLGNLDAQLTDLCRRRGVEYLWIESHNPDVIKLLEDFRSAQVLQADQAEQRKEKSKKN